MKKLIVLVIFVLFVKLVLNVYTDKQNSVKSQAESRLQKMEKIVNEN